MRRKKEETTFSDDFLSSGDNSNGVSKRTRQKGNPKARNLSEDKVVISKKDKKKQLPPKLTS